MSFAVFSWLLSFCFLVSYFCRRWQMCIVGSIFVLKCCRNFSGVRFIWREMCKRLGESSSSVILASRKALRQIWRCLARICCTKLDVLACTREYQ